MTESGGGLKLHVKGVVIALVSARAFRAFGDLRKETLASGGGNTN